MTTVVDELATLTAPTTTKDGHCFHVSEVVLVHDCGPDNSDATMRALERACVDQALIVHAATGATVTVKILASQQPVPIGVLLHNARSIFKRGLGIIMGQSPLSAVQVRTLTFRSIVWPHLDQLELTPLPVGMAQTAGAMLRDVQRGPPLVG